MMRSSRRTWITASAAATAAVALLPRRSFAAENCTRWSFEPSEAYDALVFAGPIGLQVSGPLTDEDRALSKRYDPYRATMDRITHRYYMPLTTTPHALAFAFDPLKPRTVRDLLRDVRRAAAHAPRPFYDSIADIESALNGLLAIGFDSYWTSRLLPRIAEQIAARRPQLESTDPTGTVATVMGVPVHRDVTMICGAYAGAGRIRKHRFFVNPSLPANTLLRSITEGLTRETYALTVAADAQLDGAIETLRSDRFLAPRARADHDAEGLNWGQYVHECSMQALVQVVQEQLGVAYQPWQARWNDSYSNVAMQVFAPALYAVLREERYLDRARGPFRHTLMRLIAPGAPLGPGRVEATFRRLVGNPLPY